MRLSLLVTTGAVSAGLLLAAGSARAACDVKVQLPSGGTSVVGAGTLHPLLNIESSGGNDVRAIVEQQNPVAYGANSGGVQNVINACAGSGGGFADLGDSFGSWQSKNHAYSFRFVGGTVSEFQLRMLDWGDYLPYGACGGGVCNATLIGYDAKDDVVAKDSISFSSTGNQKYGRPSDEFGSLENSGDACEAQDGQPGRYKFTLKAKGIARVQLVFKDKASIDPHMALAELCFTPEIVTIQVQVDVKPEESPNRINPKSKGTVPVAILGSASFDVNTVDVGSVTLGGAPVAKKNDGRPMSSVEDANGDGRKDLVMHFDTQSLPTNTTVLELSGKTKGGSPIVGSDSVEWVQ